MSVPADSSSPNLRGLIALARKQGVDIRPTLLRVLTDLYVQQPEHGADEIARYAELAVRLLESADEDLRKAVAGKLAHCADAPREVLWKLAQDTIAVARPVLQHGHFDDADLTRLFETLGLEHRQAIAARDGLPLAIADRLGEITRAGISEFVRHRAGREALDIAARNETLIPERRLDLALRRPARSAPARDPEPVAREVPVAPSIVPVPAADDPFADLDAAAEAAELERLALQRRPHAFAERLSASFGFAPDVAERITHDPTGEAVAAVCRAMNMPSDVFSRIVLFLNPEIGRSVAKVFALADYFGRLSPAAAREMCATWRHTRLREGPRHQPYTAVDGPTRGGGRPAERPLPAIATRPTRERA